jgi:hypothetical protein
LEVLAFSNALTRTGIYINDVAVREHALFLLLFGADDLGHVRQALQPDVTGAIKLGATGNAHWLGSGWSDNFGLRRGCLRVGDAGKGEQKQNYLGRSEPWHV